MLRRVALVLLLLIVSGAAAILAAGHLGINLPWTIAVTDHEPSSKDREAAPSADAAKTAEKPPETVVDETVAALGGGTDQAAPDSGKVEIDISRIAPDGTSVFAGRAEPDSYVTVLENGKPAGTAKTDAYGEWSLSTEHKFASADPKLSYEVSRTPPPTPEPPKQEVAKAAPPQSPSAAAVAGDVMRKFENLVEEARKEAKQNEQAKDSPPPPPADERPAAQPVAPETQESVTAAAPPLPDSSPSGPDAQADAANKEPEAEAPASPAATPTPPAKAESASAGVKTDIIPVPLMFVYNEATLTPEGERAAALLLEYLTLKRLSAVELTGHADERGSDAYNYDLSRERLDTVAKLLKDGGYTGQLTLTPKGKTEPYMGVDRTAYKGEALYQLDRRVELRVSR
jgi:outer membrane protein OmpA-like peptidoglycan-associated protein